MVIVLVDDAVINGVDLMPGPLKHMRSLGMWLPIIEYADGYGFTYGARISFVDTLGPRSRISVPLTWEANAAPHFEPDRAFDSGPSAGSRVASRSAAARTRDYLVADTRQDARIRAERALTTWLRVGGRGSRMSSSAAQANDTSRLDSTSSSIREWIRHTRATRSTWSRASSSYVSSGARCSVRSSTEFRGYLGLIGPSVLAVRATSIRATDPLPQCEQALLGQHDGAQLRARLSCRRQPGGGFRRSAVAHHLAAQHRTAGAQGFVDAGTVYASGAKLAIQRFDRGIGAGVFFTATILRAGLDVAWPEKGTRRTAVAFRARRYLLIEAGIQVGRVGKAVLAFDAFQERRVGRRRFRALK